MIKYLLLSSLLFSNVLNAGDVKVALAANVGYAIDDIKKEFHKLYPNTNLKITIGGSGKLTAQISHGAPYDIFLSANMTYPKALFKNKIAITKPTIYAQGALALFSIKNIDFKNGLPILLSNKIDKIAIANPKTAPYGKAAVEALKNSKLYSKLKHKFIYGESISQTVIYTLQAADIGIIAKSALFSPKMRNYHKNTNWVELDNKLYTPIDQGIVILQSGANNKEVKAFYDFMLSKKAKNILERFGYIVQ